MPRKPPTPKMGDRIDALETQVGHVTSTLDALVRRMQLRSEQMRAASLVLAKLSKPKEGNREGEASSGNSGGDSPSKHTGGYAGEAFTFEHGRSHDPLVQFTDGDGRSTIMGKTQKGIDRTLRWRRLENPFEELSTLRQTGRVEEFVEAFELLSSRVGRLPEEQYLGYFMSGLKPPIRRRTMPRVKKLVGKRFVGRREESGLKFGSGFNPTRKDMNRPENLSWPNPAKTGSSFGSNANPTSSLSSTGRKSDGDRRGRASERWWGVRSEEMEKRRAKGLCFKCGVVKEKDRFDMAVSIPSDEPRAGPEW
ncbi:hypothetical protein ACSQ67_008872 [Phaseolus vulgaris]